MIIAIHFQNRRAVKMTFAPSALERLTMKVQNLELKTTAAIGSRKNCSSRREPLSVTVHEGSETTFIPELVKSGSILQSARCVISHFPFSPLESAFIWLLWVQCSAADSLSSLKYPTPPCNSSAYNVNHKSQISLLNIWHGGNFCNELAFDDVWINCFWINKFTTFCKTLAQ